VAAAAFAAAFAAVFAVRSRVPSLETRGPRLDPDSRGEVALALVAEHRKTPVTLADLASAVLCPEKNRLPWSTPPLHDTILLVQTSPKNQSTSPGFRYGGYI